MLSLVSIVFLVLTSFALAEEVDRSIAMEYSGPTVIEETVEGSKNKILNWELVYIGDIGRNFSGGRRVGSSYVGLGAARVHVDLDKGVGIKGGEFFFHLQGMHGSVPSLVTGDAQIASNIESYSNTIRVMESWYKQNFLDDKMYFLFGLFDLNAEFYLTESSLLFLNSSMGLGTELAQLGPDGRTASTFPVTSLAGLLKYKPGKDYYIDLAAFDANPGAMTSTGTEIKNDPKKEGYLLISEVGRHTKDYKLSFGSWIYTKEYEQVHNLDPNGNAEEELNYGAYFMAEHHFSENFAAFLRYGTASESVNRFKDNLAAGLTIKGLINGREEDHFGLGLTRVATSEDYQEAQSGQGINTDEAETVIELTYRMKVSQNLSIQPDLQYIIDPNATPEYSDALTGFLRVQFDFK